MPFMRDVVLFVKHSVNTKETYSKSDGLGLSSLYAVHCTIYRCLKINVFIKVGKVIVMQ